MRELDLKDLQKVLVEMMDLVHKILEENNISYFLMGGNALGAVRCRGFLDWDDDIDIGMLPKDFEKLKSIRADLANEGLTLQYPCDGDWPLAFAKLRLNGSAFIEKDSHLFNGHNGIYIDIMPFVPVSKNIVLQRFTYLNARLISTLSLAKRGYVSHNSVIKKLILSFGRISPRLLNDYLIKTYLRKNKSSDFYGHFLGKASLTKAVYPAKCLYPTKNEIWSGKVLGWPHDIHKYCFIRFGEDYKSPPSESVRNKFKQHFVKAYLSEYSWISKKLF